MSLVSLSRCAIAAAAATSCMTTVLADHGLIAGYEPASDVDSQSLLDLDMVVIDAGANLQTDAGLEAAYRAYTVGGSR